MTSEKAVAMSEEIPVAKRYTELTLATQMDLETSIAILERKFREERKASMRLALAKKLGEEYSKLARVTGNSADYATAADYQNYAKRLGDEESGRKAVINQMKTECDRSWNY